MARNEMERNVDIRKFCPALAGRPAKPYRVSQFIMRVNLNTLMKESISCPVGSAANDAEPNEKYPEMPEWDLEDEIGGLEPSFHMIGSLENSGHPYVSYDEVDGYVPEMKKVDIGCDGCPLYPGGFNKNLITKESNW